MAAKMSKSLYLSDAKRNKMKKTFMAAAILATLAASAQNDGKKSPEMPQPQKAVVYQVFTRLFGNTKTTNKPWGTKAENGVGKFKDFTDKALREIKALGVTHIWYTGVPHRALIGDYTKYGISNDDPDIVKGRAGSPYAVKDYYNVDPDLAVNPAKRLEEFQALIARTHKNGLKLIIDIVPNHVARKYEGKSNPEGVRDFGADDDTSVEYRRDNNFYYIPGKPFEVPVSADYKPLGGEKRPLADGRFSENPAKWTGNGSRMAKPDSNDWFETVKINYGIKPDGTKDFPLLPDGFDQKDYRAHYEFWKGKDVPDSWKKFRDIALYWVAKGVDGFRYDMAEMVPYEFWSYLNSAIKMQRPDAFLLAEVYNPAEFRNYIRLGKMDYLYDKVNFYDKLKDILRNGHEAKDISKIQGDLADIEHHMLHFLENHDEQRLASPEFAGSGAAGKPLMVVSATISSAPTMVYFGQEVGEDGSEDGGFGKPSRTSIFDYIGVPAHQRWMNGGKFDGGGLSANEKDLREFYKKLLNFTLQSPAMTGEFREIHSANAETLNYGRDTYAFVRWADGERVIVLANFSRENGGNLELVVPEKINEEWALPDGSYTAEDQLTGRKFTLKVSGRKGFIAVGLLPSEAYVLKVLAH
jgi:glycosidase